MKRTFKQIVAVMLAVLFLSCTNGDKKLSADYHVIPQPVKIEEAGTSSYDDFAVLFKMFFEFRVLHSVHSLCTFISYDLQICAVEITAR